MFKTDCHLHTTFSPDGHQTPEELLLAAKAAGLTEITVTDHCECNDNAAVPPTETPWDDLDIPAYTKAFEKLRETSPVKIAIGVEIGQATQGKDYAEKAIAAYPWDYIIGSLHNVRGEYDFCYLDYKGRDIKKLFDAYFEQLYETVEMGGFSSLGHLYYPVRYIYRQGLNYDFSAHDAEISDILRLLSEKGIGLEINTSGLFGEFNGLIPGLKYAKMFKALGGEIITVGSDSHYSSRVGGGIETAYEMLREAGYKAVSTFTRLKPEFHDI